ncbi:MATE family efflux transporter [Abyssisolibacter fermentans]|uniref:MATE family efflux transporter n=1 Tax=Abyssisolibacter fermentans TaxID=1766203 RepID=UPI00082C1580|nr:MATE family efflux transporter [Abyssisolibacter fermentans]
MANNKKFYQFVIPSIGAMLVTGLYVVVDGIFVGRGVGTNGLAAVNIAVPFISILTAVTMMITMGGATITSIRFGKGENTEANNVFSTSIFMVMCFTLFMSIISVLFPQGIAKLLGASDILLDDTASYLKYYVLFGTFFCGSMTLSAFVRNDGNASLAFWGMIVGAVSNIFLDWLFIFPLQMGIKGAAIASGLGQVLACLVLSIHFIRNKGVLHIAKPKQEQRLKLQIIKVGTPEFITQMSQPVTILCYNLIVIKMFGEIGVSAFSVVSYLIVIILAVFIGLSQGIQPLLSRSVGEGNKEKEKYFFQKGLQVNLFLSVVINIIMFVFGRNIISIFNSDNELVRIAYNCIVIYGISFIFASLNIVYTTYNLATKRTKDALIIAVLRSFVCNSIFIFLMPILFGEKGVWLGMIVAEFVVMVIAIVLRKKAKDEN